MKKKTYMTSKKNAYDIVSGLKGSTLFPGKNVRNTLVLRAQH